MRLKREVLCLLLFGAVLWTFLPAIDNDFVGYDDPDYVTSNPHVQQGLTWPGIKWAFQSSAAGNWHPLTWLSHMLDFELFGFGAWGHHLTSILLHAISTVILFLVLRRMTRADWNSLCIAALFGLHPLRVESVAWVAERKDVLSTLFWMLSLWAYARYAEEKGNGIKEVGEPRITSRSTLHAPTLHAPHSTAPRYYALTLFLFTLGLLSKPMVVTLPFVLLLLDYWPLRRFRHAEIKMTDPQLVSEKVPFFALAAAASVVTFFVQEAGGAIIAGLPFSDRLANALVSYCRYLGKLFWPANLAAFYPPANDWSLAAVLISIMLLVAISIFVIWARRQHPSLLVGWLWFVGTLVPVIGLVQAGEQSMADRYSYIPSAGMLLLVVWGAFELTRHWRRQLLGLAMLFGVATLVCAMLTRKQISYWQDTETLFRHALKVTKNNYIAHYNLGTALEKKGRLEEAAMELEETLKEKPAYAEAHNNLGIVFQKQGRLDDAIKQYLQALQLNPSSAKAHNNLGLTLSLMMRFEEATEHFQEALKINPDYADAHYNLGVALGRQGRLDEAIGEFQTALLLEPNSPDAHNNLAVTLEKKGLLDEAIRHYLEALRLNPDYATAHFNLGIALSRKEKLDEAIAELREALRLRPDYAEAQKNLEAIESLKKKAKD